MTPNQLARIASLVGEPARAAMLLELMDGRALTAKELAGAANISAQTASRHLALMVEADLMHMTQQGRHRYHRLASPRVASMLEGMMQFASLSNQGRIVTPGPRDQAMRRARMCYDHIAGRLGLALTNRLQIDGAIVLTEDGGQLTQAALGVLDRWGVRGDAVAPLAQSVQGARPWCRPCMDWSERKPHLAGRLGALICRHSIDQGWLTRAPGKRALTITAVGARQFSAILGVSAWDYVSGSAAHIQS